MTHWWIQNWGACLFWGWLIVRSWIVNWKVRHPQEDDGD